MRLVKVLEVNLGCLGDLVDDETVPAHAIKGVAPCEKITRVNLPWPERTARLRDAKHYRTTSVDVHLDQIFMD